MEECELEEQRDYVAIGKQNPNGNPQLIQNDTSAELQNKAEFLIRNKRDYELMSDDPSNCKSYLRCGACQFANTCPKNHLKLDGSPTIVIRNFFQHAYLDQMFSSGREDSETKVNYKEMLREYEKFYHDVILKFRDAGTVVMFKCCRNLIPHLRGNVYVQYSKPEYALNALKKFHDSWYKGRQLEVKPCPVTIWKNAICRRDRVSHGCCSADCTFLHVFMNPDNEYPGWNVYKNNQDPSNCKFYMQSGACEFGDNCPKNHIDNDDSPTILVPNFFQHACLDHKFLSGSDMKFIEDEMLCEYEKFYHDIILKFRGAGTVEMFVCCKNFVPHLRGNVYVQYSKCEYALQALEIFHGSWYQGRQLKAKSCPVTNWKNAICGHYEAGYGHRSVDCIFLHVFVNPGNEYPPRRLDLYYAEERDKPHYKHETPMEDYKFDGQMLCVVSDKQSPNGNTQLIQNDTPGELQNKDEFLMKNKHSKKLKSTDPSNCKFYMKSGACKFGNICSKNHIDDDSSPTILIPNFFEHAFLDQPFLSGSEDSDRKFNEDEMLYEYKKFYCDIISKFRVAGTVKMFKCCKNFVPHLRGNVYVQYSKREYALKALEIFHGLWYHGRQLKAKSCPVTNWKNAICGWEESNKICRNGRAGCTFLHVFRNPGDEYPGRHKQDEHDCKKDGPVSRNKTTTEKYSNEGKEHYSSRYRSSHRDHRSSRLSNNSSTLQSCNLERKYYKDRYPNDYDITGDEVVTHRHRTTSKRSRDQHEKVRSRSTSPNGEKRSNRRRFSRSKGIPKDSEYAFTSGNSNSHFKNIDQEFKYEGGTALSEYHEPGRNVSQQSFQEEFGLEYDELERIHEYELFLDEGN